MPGARAQFLLLVLLVALAGGGCREEGDIQISSLKFNGVEQVDKGALRNVLQTKEGSRIPWGRKRYFDRRAFEADLKRIEAFYRDRGFPDARVTSFDVKLNDTQDKVDITVNISEGEPILVAAIELQRFDVLPENERKALLESLPLQPEQPLDRQLALAARERALNVLRDHGYPYAQVELREEEAGPRQRKLVLAATPGTLAQFGPIEIDGQESVRENVIRRQLTFEPGEVFTRREMRESQRKLYRLELFEFVNVESLEDRELQPPEVPMRVTVAEGKHRRGELRRRLRHRGAGARAPALGPPEFLRRRAARRLRRQVVVARSRRPRGLPRAVLLRPHFSLNFDGQAWQARGAGLRPRLSSAAAPRCATRRTSRISGRVSLINEYQRSAIAPEALLDFTVRDELIALGLDPRTGVSRGTLSAVAFDISRNTTNSLLDARSGYVLNARSSRRASGCGERTTTGRRAARAATTCPSGGAWSSRTDCGWPRSRRSATSRRTCRSTSATSSAARRAFAAGAGSRWARSAASGCRSAVSPCSKGRPRSACRCGASSAPSASSTTATSGRSRGTSAVRDSGTPWARACATSRRSAPRAFDFGYQLNPIDNLRVNGEPQKRRWRVHFSIGQAF